MKQVKIILFFYCTSDPLECDESCITPAGPCPNLIVKRRLHPSELPDNAELREMPKERVGRVFRELP